MKDKRTSGSWRTALECLLASFRLHAGPAMAALLFFFLVVLISPWAGLVTTVFACVLAALCFDYAYRYFVQPIRPTGTRAGMVQHPWRQRTAVALAAGLLASLLSAPVPAQSQPPQYITTVWQTEQGLPQNSVNAILQDHRGYLWIGTFGGLARFDGERFRVFDSGGTPGFGNNQILSLYESRSGILWIGTEDGLIRLENGVATTYTERDGLPSGFIQSIRGDAEGNVWIKSSGGVAKFAGAKLEAYPTHRGKAVREFYLQARDGSMWFRCETDLVRFGPDGSIATLKVRKPSVFLVQEARDGSVWVAVRDEYRLVRYYQGAFSDVPLPPIGRRALTKGHDPEFDLTMAEGADGELLLYTPAGLVRIVDGRLSPPEPLSLPANGGELPKVRSLLVDREGNLWVGMVGPGLFRLRPAPLTAYGKDEGLSDSSFNTVFQDREGRVWLGGDLLYWFDGHRFHLFPGVQDIFAIAQTGDGDLCFGGYGGLYRWRSGVLSHFQVEASAVGSIYQDREGTLWIGGTREARPGGLYRFREGKLDQIPGISGVQQIIGGRDGGFWVVAIEGLFYVRGGKAVPYHQNQSLSGHLSDIYQDSTGTLWLGTYGGGLFRFRDGRLKAITTKDGLPNNMLLRIREDGKGNLWFSSTHGIFRLSLKELNDFADGKISSLLPVSYGVAEGMRSSECNGGSPGVWKTTDGRIWFPTIRGVVAIDPAAGSRLPPPVVLEEAWANQLMLARDGQTSVPPGNHTFDFRFTALSFSAPEKLRFRYRLEPFDKDWVDAGTRRTAHYTNMAPGKYSFQVAAANDYGIWNEQGASARFVLQPHFYQTNWFLALCAAMFLAMLWAAYQFRVRQLHRVSKQLRDVVDTIPGYVWSALPDGSLDFINRRWLEFSGLSSEEGLGRGWEAAVHPDDLARFVDEWRAAVASGKAMESEARVRRADGQYRWLLIRNVPLHDKRGKIVKWYGTSTDIDDRKRAEETLREQADLLNLTHDAIFVMTMEGVIKYWNRGAEEQYGWTAEQAVGRSVHDLLKTVFPAPPEQIKAEVVRTGRWEGEVVHTKKDETRVVVASRWSLQRGEQGAPIAILETNNDITDRKRAEEALGRLNRELRAISNCNQILLRASDEQSLPEEICRIVCEEAGYRVAWVAYAEHDEAKSVRPVAWTGTEEAYLASLGITWADTERGQGPTGTAIRSGKTCCIQDFGTGPRLAPWQESAVLRDFRSGIALPLKDEHGDAFGSLNIYSAQPNAFASEEIRLLEELAADLAFGIVTLRSRAAREQAEQGLRQSEAYLAESQRLTHTGSWALDLASDRYVYVSEEDLRLWGFDPPESLPSREAVFRRIHPEDRDKMRASFEKSLREKADSSDQYRIVLPDGTVKHVHTIRHPVLNGAGEVVKLVGTSVDITERKQAEEARRESETRFRTFVDHAPDALFIFDFEQGTIVDVNRQACESLGYARQELIGTMGLAFDRKVDRAVTESIAERTAAGETVIETHWHQRKDGTLFPVEAHTSQYWYGGRRFLLKVARDITDRLQAEEALRRSEAYLAEGQRLSHAGSFAWSTVTLQSLFWSEEMFRIFGLNPQEGVPTIETFWQRIHPEDLDRTRELLLKAAHGNMEYEHDHRILLPDGTVKHIHVTGHPVVGENGQVVEYVGTAVDVTDRKRAEEERERLRQLEADLAHIDRISMMGELAASVAHEVNQPLSGVVVNGNACLRWLAGDSPNLEEAREAVRRIVRDGKRAGDIITRIRALATKTATAKERLDLNEAVQEVVAFAGDQLRKNRVAVRTEFAPGLSPVLGDRVQLQQVALNLVMNAIEAMSSVEDRPRELIVRTQNDEAGQVQVTVQDSGIGLDPQSMERIFDAFYTTKRGGMGMGLSISRSIIQNHGGKLWAVANDGPGTSVQFNIPKHQ